MEQGIVFIDVIIVRLKLKPMKRFLCLLSITFILLQSCSSGDKDTIQPGNSSTTVSDVDGNVYSTVKICNQTWTKTNLNVTKYRNGDAIPQVTDANQWAALKTGAWCYYANTSSNGTTYGKLYNWYAVNDARGLAPIGYHIPSDAEWTNLITCLGGAIVAGGKMKEKGTTHWIDNNTDSNNSSSFTGLPGGILDVYQSFEGITDNGFWWSSSQYNLIEAWYLGLDDNDNDSRRSYILKTSGLSVRCIKN
jgi:uncharacterized protein (TIGR02145 family)